MREAYVEISEEEPLSHDSYKYSIFIYVNIKSSNRCKKFSHYHRYNKKVCNFKIVQQAIITA